MKSPTQATKAPRRAAHDELSRKELLSALRALSRGDFDHRMRDDLVGTDGEICEVFNHVVQLTSAMEKELADVAEAVGREGRTKRRVRGAGAMGGWASYVRSVNDVLDDLTAHSDEIARVVTAVSKGDLTQRISIEADDRPLRGDFLRQARAVDGMVVQLNRLGSEVTRVAQKVGVEGQLGAQADVQGVSGAWEELTDSVNLMASNLTMQVREIARVTTAVAQGDLTKTVNIEVKGEILELKNTINTMVGQLSSFADEVTRVAREVGTEGRLGGQAQVRGVSGVWRELTENVNSMANNITSQVRSIADVTTAVANGDLSRKITVEVQGEILQLKNTINDMVDSLGSFADEVTRMAREVGTDGVLGGQAQVHDVSGVWKELTDNVNSMANNLTSQVRNISEVASAVAYGDLSRKITVNARGEVLDLKDTINNMVDQLNAFGAEVTRVAREVGVEGKLGGQAEVEGVRGSWKELTDNVNLMASNLTNQVRDIAEVTTAVAKGDLTRKIVVDARGEILELKSTINTMVDQLSSFAEEVTRLASDVGLEGKLGGQADVRGVSGTWRDLTDAVNSMATNLTEQVRSISQVAAAIAEGDLQKKIQVDAKGEILELKNTINIMVDQLSSFAEEVTRVARDVGTEGKLGGQASVEGVRGTWKELTDSVNLMASNLTGQVRDISQVATAIARGELGRKITVVVRGELLELKNTINTMVDQLSSFADEVTRVARDVGVEGKLGGQAEVRGVSGIWKELTDNVNLMASNLTDQVRDIAQVTTAVANGDLSSKITVEVRGEILELKNTINTMVDQLRSFADEVTRVAGEVGTEGILGGQAQVRGVSGTWRDLTDNVNIMARNLTQQVRGIARVVTAVANGDLKQELRLDTKGEIATLVQTINNMIITLSTFADQVSGVASDVGVEGRLGGQADVPGAAGIWRDLTNNVNELAGNLTRQVRAIGDVATAVTKGDLTRTIDVEARGEVAVLKDNINQMIGTLARTTKVNEEQDWLKTNLTRFTRMLQGQRDLLTVSNKVLSELAPVVHAQHGAFYMMRPVAAGHILELFATYGLLDREQLSRRYELGESLVGQAAFEKKPIHINDPPTDYVSVGSALGAAAPRSIVVVPILFEGEVKGVIELASLEKLTGNELAFIDQLLDSLGIVVATIEATMRTDELLRQSQSMAETLQAQQEELQNTNDELEQKARQLTEQRDEVELKNREVGFAKQALEEKAAQLALTSKYKSQFLANMSHELRTPLNSLLILSRRLAENPNGNLDHDETEYAQTIHGAGSDLMDLIDEVLDLAKVESGTMTIHVTDVSMEALREYVDRSFRQVANDRSLSFAIEFADEMPASIRTDEMRLRQILRNLLSNAFKFTHQGGVTIRVAPVAEGRASGSETLEAAAIVAFQVVDTGIGIADDKQQVIFEAFQQSDGGTSRRYGGTGLGLSISRELAVLLGGALQVESRPGVGSTFTLFLPVDHTSARISTPSPSKSDRLRPLSSRGADASPEQRIMLFINDDPKVVDHFANAGRARGWRGVVAPNGREGLAMAQQLSPQAIALSSTLPDTDGWVVLDQLKHDEKARRIPVFVTGAADGDVENAQKWGASGFAAQPFDTREFQRLLDDAEVFLSKRTGRLLVVPANTAERDMLLEMLNDASIETWPVTSAAEALEALESAAFDSVVVAGEPPDMSTRQLVERLAERTSRHRPPIIVYPRRKGAEESFADRSDVRVVTSREELLDAVGGILGWDQVVPPPDLQRPVVLRHQDVSLRGKKVLMTDDDVRNLFAITTVLEGQHMNVVHASNGAEALTRLEEHPDIEIVLMDVMMPEMDGYEAMERIRERPDWRDLPIVALTAKAMQGDREKCISSGASDYVTKPVDPDHLLSVLRAWLQHN